MAPKKNRQFNNEWTLKLFVREVNNRPACLICSTTRSKNKSTNVERHYNTNQTDITAYNCLTAWHILIKKIKQC